MGRADIRAMGGLGPFYEWLVGFGRGWRELTVGERRGEGKEREEREWKGEKGGEEREANEKG